jgi:4-carboxymuconolactone decarboxylase
MTAPQQRGPAARPRLAPLAPEERSEFQREILARIDMAGVSEANVFTTLVRAPRLFRHWLSFGGALLSGSLPARDRELLILRAAVNCDAPYEWGQHARIGRQAGLSDDEVERVAVGPTAAGWDDDDASLLAVADELHATHTLSDLRYAALAARYDEAQVIEVLMVVGHYELLAMTLNALGVALDEGLEPMPRP